MTLTRWHAQQFPRPIRTLSGPMTVLLDELFQPGARGGEETREGSHRLPALNVVENEGDYQVELCVPGYKREELSVEVEENRLTVTGAVEESSQKAARNYLRRESWTESFSRAVELPGEVDDEGLEASLADGVLTVTLPKRAAAAQRVKRVEIQ